MITAKKFLARWGDAEGLVRYDPAVVNSLRIRNAAQSFLTEADLPKVVYGNLHFDLPPNDLPSLPDAVPDVALSAEYARYRLLGMERHAFAPDDIYIARYFCLDEQDDGRVIVVTSREFIRTTDQIVRENFVVRPLNTSVPYLAEMLLLIEEEQRWRGAWEGTDEEEIYAHMKEVAEAMKQVDPQSLQDGAGWHDTIVGYEIGMA